MRVLLISTLLYLSGVVVILYVRPQGMFHTDGRWKEFGLHAEDGTVFPFWMFCIAWAFISYFLSGVIGGHGGAADDLRTLTAVASVSTPFSGLPERTIRTVAKNNLVQEDEEEDTQVQPLPVPVSKKKGRAAVPMRGGGAALKRGYYLYVGGDSDAEDGAEE
jgi:hypothetical protein